MERTRVGKDVEALAHQAIGAAITVHETLGPGLLESVYENALVIELQHAGLSCQRQIAIPVSYRGQNLGIGFRGDILIENRLLLELKAIEHLDHIHIAQTLTYLRLLKLPLALLINFNSIPLKTGIRRVISSTDPACPPQKTLRSSRSLRPNPL